MTGSLVIAFNNYGMRYQVFMFRWAAYMQRPEALQKAERGGQDTVGKKSWSILFRIQFYLSFTDSEFMIKLLLFYDFIIFGS